MNLAMLSDISDYTSEFSSEYSESSDEYDVLNFFKMPKKEEKVKLEQFVNEVVMFSSQYGSDFSISYTAFNITGKPSKYPNYGDFPECFAMRTYADWWEQSPSATQEFAPQNIPDIPINDFIVIQFESFVIPQEVRIFETYNPGAIVRIWAYCITETWMLLWEAAEKPTRCDRKSRIFSPPLKPTTWPTKILRLEFNHSKLDYFTEIDACLLIGEKYMINTDEFNRFWAKTTHSKQLKGPITKKLERVGFFPQIREGVNQTEIIQEFFDNGINRFIKSASHSGDVAPTELQRTSASLNELPYEIIYKILSYLDLKSLFRTAQVCKNLQCVATDPLLYTEINLKPFWYCATSDLLNTLANRCPLLRKLDLSWCGLYNAVSSSDFREFVLYCGENLTHLRLNSCKFLNSTCLEAISSTCPALKELAIRNFTGTSRDFTCLSHLTNLERLDLSRTTIESEPLLKILRNNPKLKHLNLAFCNSSVNMDSVALQIAQYNRQIVSIDMWKSHSLTAIGLCALAECRELQEADFGWCLRDEASPGEALKLLLQNCPRMKKLFLAAIRGLTDRDLDNIAQYCEELEQLDLMGIMGISTEMCYKILTKCQKLKLIDISFCDQLDELQIDLWREIFNVSIKRSFVPSDFPF